MDARSDSKAAAPVHALHYRGAVGACRRARREARKSPRGEPVANLFRSRRCRGRRGDGVGSAADLGNPLRAYGNERSGGRQAAIGPAEREPRAARARQALPAPSASPVRRERAKRHEETISRLARLDGITFPKATPKGAAVIV